MPEKTYTYIDLFAGCGGLSLGLHNAGWKGMFAIEKSPDAFKTLKHNLIDKKQHFDWPKWLPTSHHDINQVLKTFEKKLLSLRGKVDMVTGGPPCQGFSTAGKRNEGDIRNKLIDSYIKFIQLVRPKVLFFENVKGFTQEFQTNAIEGKRYSDYVIKELGKWYDVYPQLVDFSEYGIPQKRCRFILVGVKKSIAKKRKVKATTFFQRLKSNCTQFLINKNLEVNVSLQAAISDLLQANGNGQPNEQMPRFTMGAYIPAQSRYQQYLRTGVQTNIADSHRFANHTAQVANRFQLILNTAPRGKNLDKQFKEQFGIKKHTIIPLDPQSQAPTITTLPDDYIHYSEPRILTVREYARIQSFPDTYEFKGKYTTGGPARVKEVPRYTQIGNAIPPLFGEQSGLVLKQLIG